MAYRVRSTGRGRRAAIPAVDESLYQRRGFWGVVEGFTRGLGMPIVHFDNGEKEAISRETWGLNLGGGRSASRSQ
eukprot:1348629-Rhodomonas_salina.1